MPRQVLLIMTDTQRWDMLGCYRPDNRLHTPNLDRLASQGVRFERAYCCQGVCGPARSAIFTGLYPHSNGSWGNSMPLGANVKTLGQRLSDAGIRTAHIGKWHLDGGDYFGLGRCPDGWDEEYWYDMRRYLEELTPEQRTLSRQDVSAQMDIADEFTFGHRCSNRAIDFLHKHAAEDFLLVVSYDEPHGPFLAPRRFCDLHQDYGFADAPNTQDFLEDKPEHQRVWAGQSLDAGVNAPRPPLTYLACNAFVDHEIGRVLQQADLATPDAMVIYTSDHGDALGSHRIYSKGPAMYDEIMRIPLLVRPPRGQGAAVAPHPVSHVDISPTLLEYFDLPVPEAFEGRSLLPTLREPQHRLHDAIFMEFARFEIDHDGFGGFQPIRCVFDGRYKLVINLLWTDELYDLQSDPQEMINLIDASEHATVRNSLHERLIGWMNESRDPFRGYVWHHRPWRRDLPPPTWAHTGMTRQRRTDQYEPKQLDYNTGLEPQEWVRTK